MFVILIACLLFTTIQGVPILDTTNNQIDTTESSTITKQTIHDTTITRALEINTASLVNITSESVKTTVITNILNLTINGTLQSIEITSSNESYSNETDVHTTPRVTVTEISLTDDIIAGIVIGVLALVCCCACIAVCIGRTGHWETAKMWVSH